VSNYFQFLRFGSKENAKTQNAACGTQEWQSTRSPYSIKACCTVTFYLSWRHIIVVKAASQTKLALGEKASLAILMT
jgi:hypothetical protein